MSFFCYWWVFNYSLVILINISANYHLSPWEGQEELCGLNNGCIPVKYEGKAKLCQGKGSLELMTAERGEACRWLLKARVSFQTGGEPGATLPLRCPFHLFMCSWQFWQSPSSEKHTTLHIWWKETRASVECILYYIHILFYLWAQPCCKHLQIGKPSV